MLRIVARKVHHHHRAASAATAAPNLYYYTTSAVGGFASHSVCRIFQRSTRLASTQSSSWQDGGSGGGWSSFNKAIGFGVVLGSATLFTTTMLRNNDNNNNNNNRISPETVDQVACQPDQAAKQTKPQPVSDDTENNNDDGGDNDDDDDDDDDPYANLPEEDEETDCSMCKTFRKGPCSQYWRKLERCFKDNENKEGSVAVHCIRYFKPHQECIMQYTNLYQLVSLEMKQELVNDAELSVTKSERRYWNPDIDWSVWKEFTSEVGSAYKETIQSKNQMTGDFLPLWKRLPENTEPVLLTIAASLPKVDEKSGMLLKLAYAVDQDGFTVGMEYNKEYGALLDEAQAKALGQSVESKEDEQQPVSDSSEQKEEDNGMSKFEFFVLPGETKTVQVCGLYSENPVTAKAEKEILDALLFKSRHIVLRHIKKDDKS